jgi:hypothetical protein
MAYLTGTGVLKKSQVDGSYDGKPGNFVAADGKVAQAGFATSEPYIYEHEVRQWGKPVKYALVNEAGYPFYPQALSIRAADKDKLAPCLKKLVPIIQRAQVDYLANPAETNKLVLELVKQYNDGWVYTEGLANYAIEKMRSDFVKNGSDQTLGNFDNARVQRMIDIVGPDLHRPASAAQGRPQAGGHRHQRVHRPEHRRRGLTPPIYGLRPTPPTASTSRGGPSPLVGSGRHRGSVTTPGSTSSSPAKRPAICSGCAGGRGWRRSGRSRPGPGTPAWLVLVPSHSTR